MNNEQITEKVDTRKVLKRSLSPAMILEVVVVAWSCVSLEMITSYGLGCGQALLLLCVSVRPFDGHLCSLCRSWIHMSFGSPWVP